MLVHAVTRVASALTHQGDSITLVWPPLSPSSLNSGRVLTRSNLYTGASRGKQLLVLVGDKDTLANQVERDEEDANCGLVERLAAAAAALKLPQYERRVFDAPPPEGLSSDEHPAQLVQ